MAKGYSLGVMLRYAKHHTACQPSVQARTHSCLLHWQV
jgi:hypothetical protein